MIPESIWPGMFQAHAGRGKTASARSTRQTISDTVASYAISDEQGARKNALDNRQGNAVHRPVCITRTINEKDREVNRHCLRQRQRNLDSQEGIVGKIIGDLLIRKKAYTLEPGSSTLICLVCAVLISGCAMTQPDRQSRRGKFEFGLIGDLPYSTEDERKFSNLIEDINKANLIFVIHDGDFQADFRGYRDGSVPCSDETFNNRKNLAQSFKYPFILTPGDNDWTDCHYVKSATYDPLERLAKLREIFFSENDSLGQQSLSITRQSSDPKYSKFRENLRWTYGEVLFITLHMVGGQMGRCYLSHYIWWAVTITSGAPGKWMLSTPSGMLLIWSG
jgi:hypothetical protein